MVTGSSEGIGEEIAALLAAEGAAVVVHGRRREAVHQVPESIRSRGGQASEAVADLADPHCCARFIAATLDGGPVDVEAWQRASPYRKRRRMNTYLFVHRQPHGYSGGPKAAAAWEAWFSELGTALVDKGNAVLSNRSVTGDVGPALPLGGYTIVSAADLEEATRLARGCPILDEGGAVEVGMLSPVPGRQHPARTF